MQLVLVHGELRRRHISLEGVRDVVVVQQLGWRVLVVSGFALILNVLVLAGLALGGVARRQRLPRNVGGLSGLLLHWLLLELRYSID